MFNATGVGNGMNLVRIVKTLQMKSTILSLIALLTTIAASAQSSYTTSCDIRNGTAYGSVQNYSNSFTVNGSVWFSFYDSTGRLIGIKDEYEYEYVSSKSTEEIEYTSAPTGACRCSFDVSKAISASTTGQTPQPVDSGSTRDNGTCQIRNGIAYGSVSNFGNSYEINGNVWFYFYDCNGKFVSSKDEYEYEYVSAKSTEEIEHTSAPAGACSCTFDASKAVVTPTVPTTTKPTTTTTTTTPSDTASGVDYSTSCEIRNGTAYGSVHNYSQNSLTVDGTVWFYFYSTDGSYLSPEDEYEYEYVSAKSTEEIEYTSAPSGACRCTFEVKGAIKN